MSERAPLVSILLPVRNGERYLRESLDSILAQTWGDREVLVLDDASTDGTPQILEGYGDRVRVIRHPTNLGIYDNVNAGLTHVRGEFVGVYHADDIYEPTMVERSVATFRAHSSVGAVFTLDTWIDAEGREYDRLRLPPSIPLGVPLDFATTLNTLLAWKNILFVCPSAMVRTELYRKIGGYRQSLFKNSSDLDCWLRLAREACLFIVPEYLMRYRHFHGSSSHRYHHILTEPERFVRIRYHHLARQGSRPFADPAALREYEAHRAEDQLMIAVAHYIQKQTPSLRESLAKAPFGALARGRNVQRARLIVLRGLLALLARVPHQKWLADRFYARWHAKKAAH